MFNTYSDALATVPNPDDFKQGAGDDRLMVIFYRDVLQDETESVAQGRPIFRDVDFVRIHIPGDPTSIVVRPASDADKRRFAMQWARYLQGKKDEEQISGTPLKEWPLVTRAQVEELRYFQIMTVEHLADVSDGVKAKMPGLTRLAQQAKIWLERTNATAAAAQHQQTIENQANRIAVLERAVQALTAEKEKLSEGAAA